MTARSDLLGLHFAALLLGGTALFSKLIPLPALDITALRGVLATVLLALLLLATRRSFRLESRSQYLLMGAGGLLFAFHWLTYFYAMQVSSVAVGVIALFTFPVITALMEPLMDLKRPDKHSLAMSAVVLAGVGLIGLEGNIAGNVVLGLTLGVLSAIAYSARNILQRRKLMGVSGPVTMFYQCVITALVFLPFLGPTVAELSFNTWLLILLLSSVFTALPHSLIAHGLRSINATSASFILALQVFYATLLAALVLSEVPGPATIAGGLLIVLSSIYVTRQSRRSARQADQSPATAQVGAGVEK